MASTGVQIERAALERLNADLGAVEEGLDTALGLVASCHAFYSKAPASIRRQLNQAVFVRILVEEDAIETAELREPFGDLLELARQAEFRGEDDERQPLRGHAGRYLRTGSAWQETSDIGEVIGNILRQRDEEEAQQNEKNPAQPLVAQGSNVLLLAEREGFEPSRGIAPP